MTEALSIADRVRDYMRDHNETTIREIADALGLPYQQVNSALFGLKANREVDAVGSVGKAYIWRLREQEPQDVVHCALANRSAMELAWSA